VQKGALRCGRRRFKVYFAFYTGLQVRHFGNS